MLNKMFKIIFRLVMTKYCSDKCIIFISLLLATHFPGCYSSRTTALEISKSKPQTYECNSIDIRNDCERFNLLRNCTVIKGYLLIVLLPMDKSTYNKNDKCDYENMKFPLREITGFLLFHHVRGLERFRDIFPNLTVIRGRQLFLNYALGISDMSDLKYVEFPNLIAIQRGHVFIGSSPKLCQTERISWERLTLAAGQNHIFPGASDTCKLKATCAGCETLHCWSNFHCQKFENFNTIYPNRSISSCHEECLGGCYDETNNGCAVCRHLTDHGTCVNKCPTDKFLHEYSQRCYTRTECVNEMRLLTHQGLCISHCPSGFKQTQNHTCEPCGRDEMCLKVCEPDRDIDENITFIHNLGKADDLSGCQIINGSLMIIIRNKIDEKELMQTLGNIREIHGYLKIYRSDYLTSLKFLRNLEKITGTPSEMGLYSLIIYDNRKLKELWEPHPKFKMDRGGMFIHSNNKLCNHNLLEFQAKVRGKVHDGSLDSIQTNDQETLCGPTKLDLSIQVLSHRELLFSWPKDQTYDQIEIMYRPVYETFDDETELDTPICERINWGRERVFQDDFIDNGTHYSYKVGELKQNTKYACLIKTFGEVYTQTARSYLIYMTTKADIPPPPKIEIIKKTNISLTITLNMNNNFSKDYMIDHYLVWFFEKPDNVNYLDKRNFCRNPAITTKDILNEVYTNSVYDEDYDDCCARLEDNIEDERFMAAINKEFSNTLNHKNHNINLISNYTRLPSNVTQYTKENLKPFHLYVIMVQACNHISCSSYSMISERTNYTTNIDLVQDLNACYMSVNTEYRVSFKEPKNPNGAIVSYVIHIRRYIPNAKHYYSHISCVTRLQHQNANNVFVRSLNSSFNEVAVRSHSLAGTTISPWQTISLCTVPGGKRNINMFFVFFLIGCAGTALWICYKFRLWRYFLQLRPSFLRLNRPQIPRIFIHHDDSSSAEDRQILVNNYETVRFQNIPSEDEENNDTTISTQSDFD